MKIYAWFSKKESYSPKTRWFHQGRLIRKNDQKFWEYTGVFRDYSNPPSKFILMDQDRRWDTNFSSLLSYQDGDLDFAEIQ